MGRRRPQDGALQLQRGPEHGQPVRGVGAHRVARPATGACAMPDLFQELATPRESRTRLRTRRSRPSIRRRAKSWAVDLLASTTTSAPDTAAIGPVEPVVDVEVLVELAPVRRARQRR